MTQPALQACAAGHERRPCLYHPAHRSGTRWRVGRCRFLSARSTVPKNKYANKTLTNLKSTRITFESHREKQERGKEQCGCGRTRCAGDEWSRAVTPAADTALAAVATLRKPDRERTPATPLLHRHRTTKATPCSLAGWNRAPPHLKAAYRRPADTAGGRRRPASPSGPGRCEFHPNLHASIVIIIIHLQP